MVIGGAPRRHHPAGRAWTEESGLVRQHRRASADWRMRAGFPPGEAKENWAILRALSAEIGATLPYDSLVSIARRLVAAPRIWRIDEVPENGGTVATRCVFWRIPIAVQDHYLTNPIARASPVDGGAFGQRQPPRKTAMRGGVKPWQRHRFRGSAADSCAATCQSR